MPFRIELFSPTGFTCLKMVYITKSERKIFLLLNLSLSNVKPSAASNPSPHLWIPIFWKTKYNCIICFFWLRIIWFLLPSLIRTTYILIRSIRRQEIFWLQLDTFLNRNVHGLCCSAGRAGQNFRNSECKAKSSK